MDRPMPQLAQPSPTVQPQVTPHLPRLLRPERIAAAIVSDAPFRHLIGDGLIDPAFEAPLERDFPDPHKSGFFPVQDLSCGPAFRALIDELHGAAFIARIGNALGVDLSVHPQLIVARRWSAKGDGRAHTDGADKVATALIYLNRRWETDAGALRYLEGPDLAGSGTAPIPARFGVFTAFVRSETSWHGHPPFEGERRVVQVFWLTDAEALARKTKRHARTAFWKRFSRRI
jgi:hypothetical protein